MAGALAVGFHNLLKPVKQLLDQGAIPSRLVIKPQRLDIPEGVINRVVVVLAKCLLPSGKRWAACPGSQTVHTWAGDGPQLGHGLQGDHRQSRYLGPSPSPNSCRPPTSNRLLRVIIIHNPMAAFNAKCRSVH
jgi:hypothetical protein